MIRSPLPKNKMHGSISRILYSRIDGLSPLLLIHYTAHTGARTRTHTDTRTRRGKGVTHDSLDRRVGIGDDEEGGEEKKERC